MQVLQTARDFGSVEDGSRLFKALRAHVVNVELQVPAVHQTEHQTQRVLCLKCIRQAYLRRQQIRGNYRVAT